MNRPHVTAARLHQLAEAMSVRDWEIVRSLGAVRVLSGAQLERLYFTSLTPNSRGVVRRRVLSRLKAWQLVTTLARRVGGVRAGSAGLVYALDVAGQRLLQSEAGSQSKAVARRPWTPGRLFLAHSLDVAELYVQILELASRGGLELAAFEAEPACWWPDGRGGMLKPDAYVALSAGDFRDHWWVEVDRSTESLPTLRRKLATYVEFARSGQLGPGAIVPRVMVTVLDQARADALERIIASLPEPAGELLRVVSVARAVEGMVSEIGKSA